MQINRENIENYLRLKFPSSTILFAGEGWTSFAYQVDEQVFRFPKISIDDYKREAQIISAIREYCTVPIPDIKIINDHGFEYSAHNYLKGRTWTVEEFEQLSETAQNTFAKDCANFLFKLHSMPTALFEQEIPTPIKPINILEKKDFYPLLLSRMTAAELDKLYDMYLKSTAVSQPDPVVLHRDFEGKNCVVDKNFRLAGVFDFGNTKIGDRVREFSFLYNPICPTFLNKLLISYEKLSGIEISKADLKAYLLRSAVNSLPELYDNALISIKDKALDSRVKRFRFLLNEVS